MQGNRIEAARWVEHYHTVSQHTHQLTYTKQTDTTKAHPT